jgi:hypothetical protein
LRDRRQGIRLPAQGGEGVFSLQPQAGLEVGV